MRFTSLREGCQIIGHLILEYISEMIVGQPALRSQAPEHHSFSNPKKLKKYNP